MSTESRSHEAPKSDIIVMKTFEMSAQGQQNLMTQMGQSGHKLITVAPFANETGQTVGFFFYFLLEYPEFEPAEGE